MALIDSWHSKEQGSRCDRKQRWQEAEFCWNIVGERIPMVQIDVPGAINTLYILCGHAGLKKSTRDWEGKSRCDPWEATSEQLEGRECEVPLIKTYYTYAGGSHPYKNKQRECSKFRWDSWSFQRVEVVELIIFLALSVNL